MKLRNSIAAIQNWFCRFWRSHHAVNQSRWKVILLAKIVTQIGPIVGQQILMPHQTLLWVVNFKPIIHNPNNYTLSSNAAFPDISNVSIGNMNVAAQMPLTAILYQRFVRRFRHPLQLNRHQRISKLHLRQQTQLLCNIFWGGIFAKLPNISIRNMPGGT